LLRFSDAGTPVCPRFSWPEWGCLLSAFIFLLLAFFGVGGPGSRPVPDRFVCAHNLKRIAFAIEQYHQVYGCYPPPTVFDKAGKPMHSWRVLILPFLDQEELFKQYDFGEPWNGRKNSALGRISLSAYRCPTSSTRTAATMTNYLAVVAPGGHSFLAASDGHGKDNVILVAEVVDSGVNWMEPGDLTPQEALRGVNPKSSSGISSPHKGGANVCFLDGSVKFLPTGPLKSLVREDMRDQEK
jgi:prepilin-type processing-associated H-X9-DG protein